MDVQAVVVIARIALRWRRARFAALAHVGSPVLVGIAIAFDRIRNLVTIGVGIAIVRPAVLVDVRGEATALARVGQRIEIAIFPGRIQARIPATIDHGARQELEARCKPTPAR